MPRNHTSFAKASWQASKSTYRIVDKGSTHFAKWAATDHTGFSRAMDEMPKMDFIDSCKYIAFRFIIAVLGALLSAVLIFILIAFGIPLFIQILLT